MNVRVSPPSQVVPGARVVRDWLQPLLDVAGRVVSQLLGKELTERT